MLPLLVLSSLLFASCDDDETYTTSPSALLTFSEDTIRFDTVFTTIMRWPEVRTCTIKALGSASPHYNGEVAGVELLGYGAVPFTNSPEGLVVTLPEENTNAIAPVLAVSF